MTTKRNSRKPLTRCVALAAGATRGAGRGIAGALAEAGATVYCTGRSVKGKPSPYGRPETIEQTAAIIRAAGGSALALRVDHTRENEVQALFRCIMRAHKRIDVVVAPACFSVPGSLRATTDLPTTTVVPIDLFRTSADLENKWLTDARRADQEVQVKDPGLIGAVTRRDLSGGS